MKIIVFIPFLVILTACQGFHSGLRCARYHRMAPDSAKARAWFDKNSEHRSMGTQTRFQWWLCDGCGKIVAVEIFEPHTEPGEQAKSEVFFRP